MVIFKQNKQLSIAVLIALLVIKREDKFKRNKEETGKRLSIRREI
jgi:hypothetical protein